MYQLAGFAHIKAKVRCDVTWAFRQCQTFNFNAKANADAMPCPRSQHIRTGTSPSSSIIPLLPLQLPCPDLPPSLLSP